MDALIFYVIGGLVFLFSLGVRHKLRSTYARWNEVRNATDRAGGQIARIILDANRLQSIPVEAVKGTLTLVNSRSVSRGTTLSVPAFPPWRWRPTSVATLCRTPRIIARWSSAPP